MTDDPMYDDEWDEQYESGAAPLVALEEQAESHARCLRYWQRALGLDAVHAHWRRAVAANGTEANKFLGTSKHGLPDADEVLVSHMTPFVWATTRELSPSSRYIGKGFARPPGEERPIHRDAFISRRGCGPHHHHHDGDYEYYHYY